jgi:hypothetical protein
METKSRTPVWRASLFVLHGVCQTDALPVSPPTSLTPFVTRP